MKRRCDLIVANLAALLVSLVALAAGWWEAALVGLVVLLALDAMVLIRELSSRSTDEPDRP